MKLLNTVNTMADRVLDRLARPGRALAQDGPFERCSQYHPYCPSGYKRAQECYRYSSGEVRCEWLNRCCPA